MDIDAIAISSSFIRAKKEVQKVKKE